MKNSADEKDFDYKLKQSLEKINVSREKFNRSMRRWDIFFGSYIIVVALILLISFIQKFFLN